MRTLVASVLVFLSLQAGAFEPGDPVKAVVRNFDRRGHVLEIKGDTALVHYDRKPTSPLEEWLPIANLTALEKKPLPSPFPVFKAGDRVLADYNGSGLAPATVLESAKTHWRVHFDYTTSEYDEWLWPDRIQAWNASLVPTFELDILQPGMNPDLFDAVVENEGKWSRVSVQAGPKGGWKLTLPGPGDLKAETVLGGDRIKAFDYHYAGESDEFTMITAGKFSDRKAALARMQAVSSLLLEVYAPNSVKEPFPRPMYTGKVASLYFPAPNDIRVVAFLREGHQAAEGGEILAKLMTRFPDAELQKVRLYLARINGALEQTYLRKVTILGSKKSYAEARRIAEKASRDTGVRFSTRGLVPKKGGLQWPKNYREESYRGGYFPRTDNDCDERGTPPKKGCISIEYSDAYEGMTEGYYIVVGGIDEETNRYQSAVPDSYVKSLKVYCGCRS